MEKPLQVIVSKKVHKYLTLEKANNDKYKTINEVLEDKLFKKH